MGDPGIPADHKCGRSHQRSQPTKIKFAGQNAFHTESGSASHGKATSAFLGRSSDHYSVACQG